MSHEEVRETPQPQEPASHDPVASLLQKALATPPEPQIRFLPHVQERIRIRTRGRYFKKRREAFRDPIILLLMAAVLILLLGAAAFFTLEPMMGPVAPSEGAAPSSEIP